MSTPPEVQLEVLRRANESLRAGLSPQSLLERDGTIQRYEYTMELAWCLIRHALLSLGRADVSASPKPLVRDAHIEGWLDDPLVWFEFIEGRNLTSHVYKEEVAKQVFQLASRLPPHIDELLRRLEASLRSAP